MRIGGFQATSLVDYPGTVCAVIFTVGCNFRCPYCHNPELVFESPEKIYTEKEVLAHLRSRTGVLPAVTVTGGEPTLQKNLLAFLRKIRRLRLKIKLDTNGTNPVMLREALEKNLLDYVAMDVKAPLSRYPEIVGSAVSREKIKESVAILLEGRVEYEFRTTIVRSQLTREDLAEMAKEIRGARRYYLQQFNPAVTLHPVFRSKLSYSREELENFAKDISPYVTHCAVRA